ncbi:MAG: tagaturonate epimerase family protein [Victivallales bacterium]
MNLPKYSMGIGDRFAHEGTAQLNAFIKAKAKGADIAPVWNKSNREHQIIHTFPPDVRKEADSAVKTLAWRSPYFVDADHISLKNVEGFIHASDFFTLDVADFTGKSADDESIKAFVSKYSSYAGRLNIPGVGETFEIHDETIEKIARKYLLAVKEAGKIYRQIEAAKGRDHFVTEVSMDETDSPQTPVELLFILGAIADEKIPAQTIAPKFTGRFNKGVDYVGDVAKFEKEFNQDIAVIAYAVKAFGLPANLKLSVHSGSDKFSIYKCINKAIKKHNAGLHIKTAGTTWLEEVIGLAEGEGEGLEIAKQIYVNALGRFDELCGPYASVIDIKKDKLPTAEEVMKWTSAKFAATLRHDQKCKDYNPNFRQLIHVGYKVAVELGPRYYNALIVYSGVIGKNVEENIYERHIKPVFIG